MPPNRTSLIAFSRSESNVVETKRLKSVISASCRSGRDGRKAASFMIWKMSSQMSNTVLAEADELADHVVERPLGRQVVSGSLLTRASRRAMYWSSSIVVAVDLDLEQVRPHDRDDRPLVE